MASTTKKINASDVLSTQTELYESIPITGSLIYGTYDEPTQAAPSIKTYTHGMFQTVYDYPHASASANQLFDLAVGLSSGSSTYTAATTGSTSNATNTAHAALKLNMYNQMAQMLSGYDKTNNLQLFDKDGELDSASPKHEDVFFFAFSRILTKDSIKKGDFEIQLGIGNDDSTIATRHNTPITISDSGAATDYFVNSPAGHYSILKDTNNNSVGLVYYDAGIIVLSRGIFDMTDFIAGKTAIESFRDDHIDDIATEIRKRIINIKFNNVTELNSTIYHCRVAGADFNYSTNPTYLSQSKIVVKDEASNDPVSYITGVGLYSENGELLAVAKLSEPVKNTPDSDFTIKVRLDY